MNLKELLEHNEKAQKHQDNLPISEQIELLKKSNKSVFTFHMKDGKKIVRGDRESNQNEMKEFFKKHPQSGVDKIEFHK